MTKRRDLKQFLNDNQPDNILNYVDPSDIWSIQPGFKRWYEANPDRSKSRIARFVYGIIIAIPKIEKWSERATLRVMDFVYSISKKFGRR
jgi:hypothetical protein